MSASAARSLAFYRSALMKPHSLEHVSVWLEDGLPNEKVLPQALDWACRLNLPLHAVVASRRNVGSTHRATPIVPHAGMDQGLTPITEKMNAWEIACNQCGVALEMFLWLDDIDVGMNQFMRPHGLCVCVDATCARTQELLHRSAASHENAVLLCAQSCRPISRILVLYDQRNPNAAFLESVARFCQALEIHPIVLIVANSEREAHLRQRYAEGVCNAFRLLADFDFVVGFDVRAAVGRVASWRNCTHLIMERRIAVSEQQRSQDSVFEGFRGLADSLSLLALPESIVLDVPHTFRKETMSLFGKVGRLAPVGIFASSRKAQDEESGHPVASDLARG
jgi:hypothetical protein